MTDIYSISLKNYLIKLHNSITCISSIDFPSLLIPIPRSGLMTCPVFFFDLTLLDCRHSGIGVENCVHAEDVALICETEDRYGPTTDVESRWSYCGLR